MPPSLSHIRNFCIIAHIDAGKSTLADRFLEITGTVSQDKLTNQYLDRLSLERERGITIKMQPVRMVYGRRIDADQNADRRGLLYEDLTYKIRGVVFSVYNQLGPSFKESIYSKALEEEFKKINLSFGKEVSIDIIYAGKKVGVYKPDFVIDDKVILEIKSLPFLGKLEKKQAWYYLKGSKHRLALLVNFGGKNLQIERIVYDTIRDHQRLDQRESAQVEQYVLNLIDTPGHIDFSYEVSRALAAVEGAILLIDGTQGIQAQTLSNLKIAQKLGLTIVPAINKIDLNTIELDSLITDTKNLLKLDNENNLHLISAKIGTGVEELLNDVIKKIPPPALRPGLKALIFDSHFDSYKGVIAHIRVFGETESQEFKAADNLFFLSSQFKFKAIEVGVFSPELEKTDSLKAGEIGYIATGLRDAGLVKIGDTITADAQATVLSGYQEPQPVIFASVFPGEKITYTTFKESIERLRLQDPAVKIEPTYSPTFGRGYSIGCMGLLHLEIFQERLRREFQTPIIITLPSLRYEVYLKNGEKTAIQTALELPVKDKISAIQEPWASVEIYTPLRYSEPIFNLIKNNRGLIKNQNAEGSFALIKCELPLDELITGFFDDLKSISSGYASLVWEFLGYRTADLIKLDILVAEEVNPALARIVIKAQADSIGRKLLKELKELLPPQQFPLKLQAALEGRIIARETIPALSADVTGYLYGGDRTRKMKLWQKQKRGKKKLTQLGRGRVRVPNEVLIKILKVK